MPSASRLARRSASRKSKGLALKDVYIVKTAKGEYLAAKQVKRGRTAEQILAEMLPRAIHDLSWPRSMTWTGMDGARFIRPIRWIVAAGERQTAAVLFRGCHGGSPDPRPPVSRQRSAARKRFRGLREEAESQRRDRSTRRAKREDLEGAGRAREERGGYRIHEDAELLKLVTYLNECPSVLEGDFDPAYLALPDEILITVMRGHQKYFAVEKRGGEVAPHFLAVINLPKDPKGLVRAGHERVLRARLADAQFFWESDQKCRLADYLPKLERVTYESRLGSYRDKVERDAGHGARWLSEQWFNSGLMQAHVAEADRAAELSKCDLATEMVREFTELQGIVGGLYARAQGEPDDVADAIYDHYRPVGLEDPIPRNLTGCAVALADKFDSIVGCFAVGLVPTGSSDPYALRRAALGIVKIILERNCRFRFRWLWVLPPRRC